MLIIPDQNRIEESLALAREHGLGFEYNDFYADMDDVFAIEDKIALYRQNLPPETCTLHGAFYDIAVGSADAKIRAISRQRVRQSVELGKRLGARAVVFHTNTIPHFNLPSYRDAWVEENARFYGGLLASEPIDLYMENMFDDAPDLLLRLSERLCGYANYGVCLDFAHACLSRTKIGRWVGALAPYIRHIHINDCDGVSDSHLALGRGALDIAGFFALLARYGVGADMLVEVRGIEGQRESLAYLIGRGLWEG